MLLSIVTKDALLYFLVIIASHFKLIKMENTQHIVFYIFYFLRVRILLFIRSRSLTWLKFAVAHIFLDKN